MYVSDIMSLSEIDEMVMMGYIRIGAHPDLPLYVLNYTAKAAYEKKWNDATSQCRGLIIQKYTRRIVARPFPKFFNFGETEETSDLPLNEKVVVTDKLDGSLGILYPGRDGLAMATRGSFVSEQATVATEILRDKYGEFDPDPEVTYLFEIIYPENQIVVDYGGVRDLYLIGAIETETGASLETERWPGPSREVFEHATLADAICAEPRPNAEGLVVFFPSRNCRVKIKQEDYVALHRIITGMTERTVWEAMGEDKFDELIETLPDEFHDWARKVREDLNEKIVDIEDDCHAEFDKILTQLEPDYTRKEFAEIARESVYKWGLFMLLDGKDIVPSIIRQVRPAAVSPQGIYVDEELDTA